MTDEMAQAEARLLRIEAMILRQTRDVAKSDMGSEHNALTRIALRLLKGAAEVQRAKIERLQIARCKKPTGVAGE